jgi:hypothetical protein
MVRHDFPNSIIQSLASKVRNVSSIMAKKIFNIYPASAKEMEALGQRLMDSCPDRWGQILMKRREAVAAKEEGRTPKTLGPWEFLLGVQDCTRMGALRFTRPGESGHAAQRSLSVPPPHRLQDPLPSALSSCKASHCLLICLGNS